MVLNIGLKCWAILGVPHHQGVACILQWMAMEWSTSSWIPNIVVRLIGTCLVYLKMVIWHTTLDHILVHRVGKSLIWGRITLGNRISLQI